MTRSEFTSVAATLRRDQELPRTRRTSTSRSGRWSTTCQVLTNILAFSAL